MYGDKDTALDLAEKKQVIERKTTNFTANNLPNTLAAKQKQINHLVNNLDKILEISEETLALRYEHLPDILDALEANYTFIADNLDTIMRLKQLGLDVKEDTAEALAQKARDSAHLYEKFGSTIYFLQHAQLAAQAQFQGFKGHPAQGLGYVSSALGATPNVGTVNTQEKKQLGIFDYLTAMSNSYTGGT
jgi:chromosome condensin MukBEF ATPase and DNA-binding subunit MukB